MEINHLHRANGFTGPSPRPKPYTGSWGMFVP